MPQRTAFTPTEEAAIVARYTQGETCQRIAGSLDLSFAIIKRVLVGHGVYEFGRKFRGRLSQTQKDEMEALYLAGATQRSLGKRYGCHRANVHIILKRRGVELRDYEPFRMDSEMEATIRARRDGGLNFADIAREMGVPPHRVLKWARELGISDFKGKTGSDSHAWRGGRTVHGGYTLVRVSRGDPFYSMSSNSYAPEHRLVMARSLGRLLADAETVHHINGDRADNRRENLQLRKGQHGKGAAYICLDCGSHNVAATPLN